VVTVDPVFFTAQGVAVRGDRLLPVGRGDGIASLVGRETWVVGLRGRAVVPSLIDGHAHLDREASTRRSPARDR
jgi:predicted amidohydrolase YtcJ